MNGVILDQHTPDSDQHRPYCEQAFLKLMTEDLESALQSEHLPGLIEHIMNTCRQILGVKKPGLTNYQKDEIIQNYTIEIYEKYIKTGKFLEEYHPEKDVQLATFLSGLVVKKANGYLKKDSDGLEVYLDLDEDLDEEQLQLKSLQGFDSRHDWETLDKMTFSPKQGLRFTEPLKCLGGQLGEKMEWHSEPGLYADFLASLKVNQHRLDQILHARRINWAEKLFETWRLACNQQYLWQKSLKWTETKADESLSDTEVSTKRRNHHRLMQSHTDDFNKNVVVAVFHPLSTKNIQELFHVTTENADQMKSRSRKKFYDLVKSSNPGSSLETFSKELLRLMWEYREKLADKV